MVSSYSDASSLVHLVSTCRVRHTERLRRVPQPLCQTFHSPYSPFPRHPKAGMKAWTQRLNSALENLLILILLMEGKMLFMKKSESARDHLDQGSSNCSPRTKYEYTLCFCTAHELIMVFTLLNWKKKIKPSFIKSHVYSFVIIYAYFLTITVGMGSLLYASCA